MINLYSINHSKVIYICFYNGKFSNGDTGCQKSKFQIN